MNIGIIFGGNSLEHEISIVTAYSLYKKLVDRYKITMVYIDLDNNIYDATKVTFDDFKNNKLKKLKKTIFVNKGIKRKQIDCMILACHGENSEDGIFAAMCRFYNIPFVGCDVFSGSICMNKYLTYLYLHNNIDMLETKLYTYNDYINNVENDVYPCIVKPVCGGSSLGISIIKSKENFNNEIIKVFDITKEVIIQRYYENVIEYNLSLYEDGCSNLEKINNKGEIFSFNDKYNESFKLMHQNIDEKELYCKFETIGKNVYKLLDCKGIIRIDYFYINEKIYVNEVNTTPGGLSMYLYDNFDTVIDSCIRKAMLYENIKYNKSNYLSKTEINK